MERRRQRRDLARRELDRADGQRADGQLDEVVDVGDDGDALREEHLEGHVVGEGDGDGDGDVDGEPRGLRGDGQVRHLGRGDGELVGLGLGVLEREERADGPEHEAEDRDDEDERGLAEGPRREGQRRAAGAALGAPRRRAVARAAGRAAPREAAAARVARAAPRQAARRDAEGDEEHGPVEEGHDLAHGRLEVDLRGAGLGRGGPDPGARPRV